MFPELYRLDSLGFGDFEGMLLPKEFRFLEVDRSLFFLRFLLLLRSRFRSLPLFGDTDLEVLLYGDGLLDFPNVFRFDLDFAI